MPLDKSVWLCYFIIVMSKKVIAIQGKRPADATPEKALELSKTFTNAEIGRLWNISRERVRQLIKKANSQKK